MFIGFNGDLLSFWKFIKDVPELCSLAELAMHLFNVCTHSAALERVWSLMGNTHTKTRNRLSAEKVTSLALLKMDVVRKRKAVEAVKATMKRSTNLRSSEVAESGIPAAIMPLTEEDSTFEAPDADDLIQELEELIDYYEEDVNDQASNADWITFASFLGRSV